MRRSGGRKPGMSFLVRVLLAAAVASVATHAQQEQEQRAGASARKPARQRKLLWWDRAQVCFARVQRAGGLSRLCLREDGQSTAASGSLAL